MPWLSSPEIHTLLPPYNQHSALRLSSSQGKSKVNKHYPTQPLLPSHTGTSSPSERPPTCSRSLSLAALQCIIARACPCVAAVLALLTVAKVLREMLREMLRDTLRETRMKCQEPRSNETAFGIRQPDLPSPLIFVFCILSFESFFLIFHLFPCLPLVN